MKYWKNGFNEEPQVGSVEITEEYYNELLDGQSSGSSIYTDENGYPQLQPYQERIPTEQELAEQRMVDIQRELSSMDYLDAKDADAEDMTKYGDWRECRRELREEYNQLEVLWVIES